MTFWGIITPRRCSVNSPGCGNRPRLRSQPKATQPKSKTTRGPHNSCDGSLVHTRRLARPRPAPSHFFLNDTRPPAPLKSQGSHDCRAFPLAALEARLKLAAEGLKSSALSIAERLALPWLRPRRDPNSQPKEKSSGLHIADRLNIIRTVPEARLELATDGFEVRRSIH